MMSDLMADIISTAENFADNFRDKGYFDFSIDSLRDVNNILEEIGDFVLDENEQYNCSTMVGSYIFEDALNIARAAHSRDFSHELAADRSILN